jgi:hypothetical protein
MNRLYLLILFTATVVFAAIGVASGGGEQQHNLEASQSMTLAK